MHMHIVTLRHCIYARMYVCMVCVDVQLHELAASLEPEPKEMAAHADTLGFVRGLLTKRWPEASVHLFGSAANQLCIHRTNDIDVCLEVPGVGLDDHEAKGGLVEEMGRLLEEAGMHKVRGVWCVACQTGEQQGAAHDEGCGRE